MTDDMPFERLDIHHDIGKFGQRQCGRSIFLKPVDDLLARPVMVVVQMENDRVERQPFVAAFRATASDVFEAIEETIHARPDRVRFVWIPRQRVCAFVCRTESAGSPRIREVLAKRLCRSAPCAGGYRFGELELIFTWHLMHLQPLSPQIPAIPRLNAHSTPLRRRAHLFETERFLVAQVVQTQ